MRGTARRKRQKSAVCSRHTLHPTPYTLHPTPYTLHPTPYTLHPPPYTPHSTPYTLHPAEATAAVISASIRAPARGLTIELLWWLRTGSDTDVRSHYDALSEQIASQIFLGHNPRNWRTGQTSYGSHKAGDPHLCPARFIALINKFQKVNSPTK